MTNNDILRRLRYTFDFNDTKMIELFALAEAKVTRAQVSDWLKKEDDPDAREISDVLLATFLNGFINDKRGKRDGPQIPPEENLSNNAIFRKLKIALNLKDTDIVAIFDLVDMRVSKHEITALFRNPSQNQYRACKDQFLRVFLQGLNAKYREKS